MNISSSLRKTLSRQLLVLKKNAPNILFAAGVGGVVGGTVMACRATTKAGPVLDQFNHDIKGVHELKARHDEDATSSYDQNEYGKDMAYVYAKGTWRLVKLYAPAAALSVGGILLLSSSHGMLIRRNAALTSTLALASKAIDDYRNRVRREVGHEKEKELYVGGDVIDVVEQMENGERKVIAEITDTNTLSLYSKVFGELNDNWEKDTELNRNFLQLTQRWANAQLYSRGHLFLNEVYEMLGLEHTQAGAIVGWVLRGENSDNYVDFGIFERKNYDAVNGYESSFILDFNVDGVIYNLI